MQSNLGTLTPWSGTITTSKPVVSSQCKKRVCKSDTSLQNCERTKNREYFWCYICYKYLVQRSSLLGFSALSAVQPLICTLAVTLLLGRFPHCIFSAFKSTSTLICFLYHLSADRKVKLYQWEVRTEFFITNAKDERIGGSNKGIILWLFP